ncbi:DUF4238 domain-containing protein [Brevundimonas naejangsanensis]
MSGIKQHFIPQLLLRRFGTKHPKREKTQVCVYPKGGAPFIAATDGVAAQRYFYSELSPEGQETLDDRITDHEAEVLADLELIDAISPHANVPADIAGRVIAHLTIRNGHVRQAFAKAGTLMATEGLDRFRDPAWVSAAIGLDQNTPDARIQKMIRDEAAKIPGGAALLAQPGMQKALFAMLKVNFAREQPAIARAVGEFQARFVEDLPQAVRKAHVKALDESLAPEARVAKLASLDWTVQPVPEGTLILPDCVALAKAVGAADLIPTLFLSNSSVTEAVFMPLAPDRVLTGTAPDSTVAVPADWNRAAAAASADFFIGKTRDLALARLTDSIGTVVETYMDDQLRPAFDVDPRTLLDH